MTSYFCNLFCKRCGTNLHAMIGDNLPHDIMIIGDDPLWQPRLLTEIECSRCLLYMSGRDALNELQAAFLDADDHRMLGELDAMTQPTPRRPQ